jgi:hypothetical protein
MGLDQYAYVAAKAQAQEDYYEERYTNNNDEAKAPREIAYWRKHPNLQGWMQNLWLKKLNIPANASDQVIESKVAGGFNGVEVELTWEDLDNLEKDIKTGAMAQLGTKGFFFGDASDDHYREDDLAFVKQAKAELFCGLRVFYNSSW